MNVLGLKLSKKLNMRRSLKVGSVFGVGVYIHWSFFLIPAWVTVSMMTAGAGLAGLFWANLFVLLVFGCIFLHELGHSYAAKLLGIGTRHITMLPIGGVAALERMPRRPLHEAAVAIAGPAVNFLLAGVLMTLCLILNVSPDPKAFLDPRTGLLPSLLYANLVIGAFNLLPIFPMDGGRLLRAAIAAYKGHIRGTLIAARIGQALAIGLGLLALFGNPFLLLLAAFLIMAAEAERRAVLAEGRMVEMWLRTHGRNPLMWSFGSGQVKVPFLPAEPEGE